MANIKRGSKGEDVKLIQRKLNCYPDGIFGEITEEAVKQFQKDNNLVVDGIVGPLTLKALNLFPINKRKIDYIIVHCSATIEGKEYEAHDIRKFHLERGFSDIGYHFVIQLDGTCEKGRDEALVGAHCLGKNANSIGVCYIGGLDTKLNPKDTRTEAQKRALLKLLKELKAKYGKHVKIASHKDYALKACPCFDATAEYADI